MPHARSRTLTTLAMLAVFGVFGVLAPLAPLAPLAAQGDPEPRIAKAVRDAARPLDVVEGALSGAGADWLLERARAARFVLLGESHGNRETPHINLWLLDELRGAGFGRYAIETGPVTTEHAVALAREGGFAAVKKMQLELPFAIAFLNFRADAEAFVGALDLGYEVWGLDQEFMGSGRFLLQQLVGLAPDDAARALASRWHERAVEGFAKFVATGDQSTGFIVVVTDGDLDELDAAFASGTDAAKRILRELRVTATIYRHYREGRGYSNNRDRIRLMKQHLLERLGKPDEKVVFRFGSAHMGRGFSPFDQLDLGNQAAELAFASGDESFHVYVFARRSIGQDGAARDLAASSAWLRPLYDVVEDEGPCTFDLTALRPLLGNRRTRESNPQLHDLARRFDAALILGELHASEQFVPLRR